MGSLGHFYIDSPSNEIQEMKTTTQHKFFVVGKRKANPFFHKLFRNNEHLDVREGKSQREKDNDVPQESPETT